MKNKIKMFLKQNGFLLILFIGVCIVAVSTLRIATMNLRASEDIKDEELVILEEIKDDSEDDTIENVEVSALDDPKDNYEDTQELAENGGVNAEDDKSETNAEEPMVDEPVQNEEDIKAEKVEPEIEETSSEELEYIDDFEDFEEEEVQIVTNKPIEALLPVQGEVISEISTDQLVFSKTLEEWRTHNGIDIKAKVGTKVVAPLDGTIKQVFEDDLWGITIIIDHGDGLETKLANLGTMEMVEVGINVKKGDYISTVGKSATIEMLMDDHLHYEATKNGKIIDPRSITN